MDVFSYWFATYSWDFVNYFVPVLGILILFAAFQVESYKDELGVVFLMLVSKINRPCTTNDPIHCIVTHSKSKTQSTLYQSKCLEILGVELNGLEISL